MDIASGTDDFGGDFQFKRFVPGDEITVVEGPFQGFDGTVIEVDQSLQLAVIKVPVFGRHHRVPLRFHELAKREDETSLS